VNAHGIRRNRFESKKTAAWNSSKLKVAINPEFERWLWSTDGPAAEMNQMPIIGVAILG
jgi:hypothetical protein